MVSLGFILDNNMKKVKSGFTLIEILVAITILSTLIGLLLPAVQSVRESARRITCLNNLKQQGLAIINYESANRKLPLGGFLSKPFINGIKTGNPPHSHGHSWMLAILPYCENGNLFQSLDLTGTYFNHTGLITNAGNLHNRSILKNIPIEMYWCPTSTLDKWGWIEACLPHYAGVAGACDQNLMNKYPDMFTETTTQSHGGIIGWGIRSSTGIMISEMSMDRKRRQSIKYRNITDGISKTIMVCEQSGVLVSSIDKSEVSENSSHSHGFCIGPEGNEKRDWNITTIRYGVNDNDWTKEGIGGWGIYGQNKPMYSMHNNIVCCLLADGSVRVFKDDTNLQILFNYCNRSDGNHIGQ